MEPFFSAYLKRFKELGAEFIKTFDGLPQEALDWVPGTEINSFCVLVVHINAAGRYWVGDVAMQEPSNRDRDAEFTARGLNVDELKAKFAATEAYLEQVLPRLSLSDLATVRIFRGNQETTVGYALLHALEHLSLHLGHAQLMRQMWDQGIGR